MNENNVELEAVEGGEIDLRKYIDIIVRQRWVIISVTIIAMVITLLVSFTMRPVYTARGTVMIEKEPNILSFEEIFQVETFRDDYFQTQYKLLQSRSLAERVVKSTDLVTDDDFFKPHSFSVLGALTSAFSGPEPQKADGQSERA